MSYLKCIACSVCVCLWRRGSDRWRGTEMEEERCCTGAWQAGYYNNEDGCVYHELCIPFQSLPSFASSLHTSFALWLTWVAPSASYIWWTGTSSRRSRLAVTACLEGKVCFGVCVSTVSASTTRSHPSTFVAKARCSDGGVMGCGIWAGEKRATPRFSALSDRASRRSLHRLHLYVFSHTPPYFPIVF